MANQIHQLPTANQEEKPKQPQRGSKLKALLIMLICLWGVLYITLIPVTMAISSRCDALVTANQKYIDCENQNAQLTVGSDYLTEQVRLYVITQERQYLDNYFTEAEVTRRRDLALEAMAENPPDQETYDYLQTALDNSNLLMNRELYAMKLVTTAQGVEEASLPQGLQDITLTAEDAALTPEQMLKHAQELVFAERYQASKESIRQNLDNSMASLLVDNQNRQQLALRQLRNTLYSQRWLLCLLFAANLLLLGLLLRHNRNGNKK